MTADAPAVSLTRRFTDLLSAWPADDPALMDRCRLLLLDGLAVAVAGAAAGRGPALMAAQARSESPEGPATVIGQGFTTNVANAARVNGMAMHVLDFEPMWNPPNHALSPLLLASGSLARFWEVEGIVGDAKLTLPELRPTAQAERLRTTESKRVRYVTEPRLDGPGPLADAAAAAPGPRLLIMNTVQSAAVMARYMRRTGHDALHLSTALCPRDRQEILETVRARLDPTNGYRSDWTLVATSLMEAGVDLSFRTPFRERFATTSLIQIGGRGNRNFEWSEGVTVHDFVVSHVDGLQQHPGAAIPARVLADLFNQGKLIGSLDPANLVTAAMRLEMRQRRREEKSSLVDAECERRYPEVATLGRVIDADTRLVVVDPSLHERIIAHQELSTRELLFGSVQIWAKKIDLLALDTLPGRREIYWWPHAYDPSFLGYMAGALDLRDVMNGKALVV